MDYLELNFIAVLSGLVVVAVVAFLRVHWSFRFQYMGSFVKKKPEKVVRLLEASYRKNRKRPVACLDKSSSEIITGNYDQAEKFVAEGLTACKATPSLFNKALIHYLFYNLAIIYFYSGKYKDSLDVAFRIFERDHSLTNALGLIVCAHARMGDIQSATEAFSLLEKKRLRPGLKFFCLAELEAAKGDFHQAIQHLQKVESLPHVQTLLLHREQIEKRLEEWTKQTEKPKAG